MSDHRHPSLRRILNRHGDDLFETLATRLSTPDLTSLLLAVQRHRAESRTPAKVLAQYRSDRFVAPSLVSPKALRQVATIATRAAGEFDEIELAPLAPLGLHSGLGGISQNRVVSTSRSTEVAADPTSALALEAAVRRTKKRRSDTHEEIRLCAVQRVTRAQAAEGPLTFAHFTIFGLVTANRDEGDHRFERASMLSHIQLHAAVTSELGLGPARVALSDLSGKQAAPLDWLVARLRESGIDADPWHGREAGTDYYPSLCFKVFATDVHDEEIEIADGGITPWTQQLAQNRKERLMTSGAGLDRLAVASPLIDS